VKAVKLHHGLVVRTRASFCKAPSSGLQLEMMLADGFIGFPQSLQAMSG
jgi:hypothetical protein